MIRKVWYYILRKFNGSQPSKQEIAWALSQLEFVHEKVKYLMALKSKGYTYYEVATMTNIPTDKVQRIITMAVRLAWKRLEEKKLWN